MAIHDFLIGKKCIVRSRDQGVVYGTVEGIDGRSAKVRSAVQMYRWTSKFVLIELASFGPKPGGDNRFSSPSVEPILMTETCGVLPCSIAAIEAIESVKPQVF